MHEKFAARPRPVDSHVVSVNGVPYSLPHLDWYFFPRAGPLFCRRRSGMMGELNAPGK